MWGADYRRYGRNLHLFVWISLLRYCFHPALSPFFCKVVFTCLSLAPFFVVTDLRLNSFLSHTIGVR
ncbi:putative methyltransferase [Salmonella enterica subsp. enterica serovar Typhimurium str. 14028S]|uniref:Methyltransferase n=1 Tax=Salmonella typhimurium (strain 14028s / SGSC 2262) TaxID=588858 RepID=A0A0F6B574_SALT1|nr:putative methyltransferase [Salmonella enterica subsp. enterica serovar Typhimurium str. 14028S]